MIIVSVLILSQTGFAQEKVTKVAIIGNSITEGTFLKNPVGKQLSGTIGKNASCWLGSWEFWRKWQNDA